MSTLTAACPASLRLSLEWILEGPCRGSQGEIAGWTEDRRPAFWYPEVGGYFLSFCAFLTHSLREPAYLHHALGSMNWLRSSVAGDGGVGLDGVRYVFDTAIVLRGTRLATAQEGPLLARMAAFCQNRIRSGDACTASDSPRWSRRMGPHMLKAAAILDRVCGLATWEGVQARLRENAPSPRIFLHGFCYAIEGMLLRGGAPENRRTIAEGADLLARLQTPEGGLPSHSPGPATLRSDATAQAVRIWLLVDPERYREEIARGLTFLEGLASPQGGLLYEPGSPHVNVWSTLFALQACLWAQGIGGTSEWLL